jgi:hypothetical protein
VGQVNDLFSIMTNFFFSYTWLAFLLNFEHTEMKMNGENQYLLDRSYKCFHSSFLGFFFFI